MSNEFPGGPPLEKASDVLQGLIENGKSRLGDGFTRWRLEQEWSQVVGSNIGQNTCPAAFDRGTLYIWVRHSTWMHQLWFFRDVIKDKVNARLNRQWVKEVRFTLNRRSAQGDDGANVKK